MITYENVFEIMGRVHFPRTINENIVLIGKKIEKRSIYSITKGLIISNKLYNCKFDVKVIESMKPHKRRKQNSSIIRI